MSATLLHPDHPALDDDDQQRAEQEACAQHYAVAMNSVRDLLDNSIILANNACCYAPSAVHRHEIDPDAHPLTGLGTSRAVHNANRCRGQRCVLHNPSHHHMSTWPMLWRDDVRIFERFCVCGVGHPDPDQIDYWRASNRLHLATHTCDGCCNAE